jgi:hypothetical protein
VADILKSDGDEIESPSTRLVRLERAPAPRTPQKKIRLTNILILLFGALVVAGGGLAIGWYVLNMGTVTRDRYAQVREKVENAAALDEKVVLLQSFLQENPQTPHAAAIKYQIAQFRTRIEEIEYEQTILQVSSLPVNESYEDKAIMLYGDFLEKYPETQFQERIATAIRDTKQLVDQFYYEELVKAARLDFTQRLHVYKRYLSRFPEGRFKRDVDQLTEAIGRQHLDHLKSESLACDQKQRWESCIVSIDGFIADFDATPLGREAELFKAVLQDKQDLAVLKKFEADCGNDYIKAHQAYREYLKQNPQSSQKAAVEKELSRLGKQLQLQQQWQSTKAQALDSRVGLFQRIRQLDRYLREHLSGPYAAEAQDLMNQLESQRAAVILKSRTEAARQEEKTRLQRQNEEKAQHRLKIQQMRRELEHQLSGSERYHLNGDLVIDQSTRMTWTLLDSQQELGGCLTYPAALEYIQNLSTRLPGNFRLPTASELAGLYKQKPFFPASGADWYWSSEAYARGYHSVADVVTSKPETIFQRDYRRQDQCGAVRAVLVK